MPFGWGTSSKKKEEESSEVPLVDGYPSSVTNQTNEGVNAQSSGGNVLSVVCTACNHQTSAPPGAEMVECSSCKNILQIGAVQSQQVYCPSCQHVNLIPQGCQFLKCGACTLLMKVPGAQESAVDVEQQQLQEAIARSKEDEDTRKALQASLNEY
eukprot:TRINITY_DN15020_c0_g1_i1.p1 TRINITY_DN15020_c0_g1~~TRINITY_DN15020_c0_g1_i1.p1  ORF type:complete len:155 (-),score=33.79 TRINITY_DN15020_c0_g1_i1:100-564(-)